MANEVDTEVDAQMADGAKTGTDTKTVDEVGVRTRRRLRRTERRWAALARDVHG